MASTYAEAKTVVSHAALRARALARLADAKVPVAGWSESAPQRVLVDDHAARLAEESRIRADLARSLDVSELASLDADWVDAWCTWYQETRIPALAAVWDVPLTSSLLPLTVQPTTPIVVQALGGIVFEAAQPSPIVLPGSVRFRARATGTAGNISPSSLATARISTGPAGLAIADTPTLFVAGRAIESPAEAIRRCLAKWGTLGAGWTAEAFDYWIPTAAPSLPRWRVRDDNPFGPGTTAATLANASGPATEEEVGLVQARLSRRDTRPLGSAAFRAKAATARPLTISARIVSDGSNGSVLSDVAAALRALGESFAIGPATLYFYEIVQTIMDVKGVITIEDLDPGTDTEIDADSVIVITPEVT